MAEKDIRIEALADYLNVDYATAQEAVYAGRYQDEMATLDSEMSAAEDRRNTATPGGREAGRVYVAANPLEHAAAFLQRRRGGKEVGRVRDAQAAAMDKRDRASIAIASAERAARDKMLERMYPTPPQSQSAPTGRPAASQRGPGLQATMAGPPRPQQGPPPPSQSLPVGTQTAAQVTGSQPPPPPQSMPQSMPQSPSRPMPPAGPSRTPQQGPPVPGWFDQNQARSEMQKRLNALGRGAKQLYDFKGFAR